MPLASQDSLASHDSLTDTDDDEEEEMRQREAAERQEKRKQNTAGSQPSASQAGDDEEEEGLILVPSAASISNAEVGWGPCWSPSVRSEGKGERLATGLLPAPC